MRTGGGEAFDVAVVGGGSAGIAAALAASRLGAHTLLAESAPTLGGNATGALVHTICGLFHPPKGESPEYAHPGFPREFAEELLASGCAAPPERAGRVWFLPTRPRAMAEHARVLCAQSPSLDTRTHCRLVAAELHDREGELQLRRDDGTAEHVRAELVIDASGDGAFAALCGADTAMESGDSLQHPSFIFEMADVDTSELAGFTRLQTSVAVAGAVRSGTLPAGCESVVVRPSGEPGRVYVTLGVPKLANRTYAPLDADYRRALEADARGCAESVAEFLRASRPAFRQSRVHDWPRCIGIRETRRVLGEAVLEREDVLEGRRRDDEVAVSTWPIELWHDHRRASFEYPESPCSVPLAALVSRSHPRLGMAGRCLSATHEAHGALRVIGTALATGEAIGAAAALAADAGVPLAQVTPAAVRRTVADCAERMAR